MTRPTPTGVVIALAVAIAGPAFASHEVRSKHGIVAHRHARVFGGKSSGLPQAAPRALDHRDPTRPGGIDPSFHPPPT